MLRWWTAFILIPIVLFPTAAGSTDKGVSPLLINIMRTEPTGYLDDQGKPTGLHVELFRRLEKLTGITMEQRLLPISRGLRDMAAGRLDGGLAFRNPDRDGTMIPVLYMYDLPVAAVGRSGVRIQSIHDMRGRSIGVVRGMPLPANLPANLPDDKLVRVNGYPQLVKMAGSGRVDMIVGNYYTFWHLAGQLNVRQKLAFPGIVLKQQRAWFYLSKKSGHQRQIPALRAGLQKLKDSGYLDQLFSKYYGITP